MVKYLKGKSTLDRDPKGDVYVESDCEGDSSGANKEAPEAEDEKEEATRAVLITGSFAAYAVFNNVFFCQMTSCQLEISLLLPLYRHGLIRPPQIARRRPSLGLHPRKDGGDGTASLLAKEHLPFG